MVSMQIFPFRNQIQSPIRKFNYKYISIYARSNSVAQQTSIQIYVSGNSVFFPIQKLLNKMTVKFSV